MNFYDDFSSEDEFDVHLQHQHRFEDQHRHNARRNHRLWQPDVEDAAEEPYAFHRQGARRRQLPAVPSPPLSLDWLNLTPYGFPDSVALSELPGSRFRGRYRDLVTDIGSLKHLDISDIVVLLTQAEFRKFRVPNLLSDYEDAGFVVFHFPIDDGMVPEDVLGLISLVEKIRKRVADGNRVLVHCYGGLGRAVLVGACLLQNIDEDISPDEVIAQLRELRGPRAVQSVKQYNFINEYRDLCHKALNWASEDEGCISR